MLKVSQESKSELLSAGFRSIKPRSEPVNDLGALAEKKPAVHLLLGREDFLPLPKVKIFPGIPCGTLANKENVEERIRRGYRFPIVPTEREFEAVRIGRGAAR